jgi:demethylmenaquinone methyltransferase/2-methoxy-6-polyprenyl-1,4-benzoquinol methylase
MMHRSDTPDIEKSGITAKFYDQLIFVFTLGFYHRLLKRIIEAMAIEPDDHILDMGAGTGKNALLMKTYLKNGSITALEISPEMIGQFRRKCMGHDNVNVRNLRVEQPLPYHNRFDKVFISYVIHGFEREQRSDIVQNAWEALREGGELYIFDWNEFQLDEKGPIMRFFMRRIECAPTIDFLRQNFREELMRQGFGDITERLYWRNNVRLLRGRKTSGTPTHPSKHEAS